MGPRARRGTRKLAIALAALAWIAPVPADDLRPGATDKCPVCGMFVARYPEWLAGVRFRDGTYAVFDGAKDLLRFLLSIREYAPSRRREDVTSAFVTDYYAVKQIPAEAAYFVVGSDVLGPMGRELVPFEDPRAADEFRRDHRGEKVLRIDEVTPALLKGLR